jgi:hypothetical protein
MINDTNESMSSALSELTGTSASDWRNVGRVLTELESKSRIAPDGEQWISKVVEKLGDIGHSVSIGHLHKVRRAYGFLTSGMKLMEIPEENSGIAKVSSIEIAERLYQIDSKAGFEALAACLDPSKPATAASIKKRYDTYLEKHPTKKSAMHAAWEQRKKTPTSKNAAPADHDGDSMHSLSVVVSQVQKEARKKDEMIKELQEDLSETRRLLAEVQYELAIMTDQLKDANQEILGSKRR